MRGSVTNSYIVNLAVSDFCFLVGLPFLVVSTTINLAVSDFCFLVGLPFVIVTGVLRRWIFGYVFCKLFYSLTALNWFTSVCYNRFRFIQYIVVWLDDVWLRRRLAIEREARVQLPAVTLSCNDSGH